jgi:MOSC domain-containing protein YiiM
VQTSIASEPTTVGSVLSVNVGKPRNVDWNGRTVYTGIWKSPVAGPQTVRRLNIDGDGQGDTAGHGGENRAVMAYQIESYRYWQQQLDRDDFGYGQFGENFTITGLADSEVCIGDRYRIGTAEFEVTQPRVTCFRVGLRLGRPDMPGLLVQHHRPSFYLRVIAEGVVTAGDDIIKTAEGPHRISVADIDALLYLPNPDLDLMRRALDIAALSPGWHGSFRELLAAAEVGRPIAGPVTGREPAWPGFRPLRIVGITRESRTVSSFRLADPSGATLAPAPAGQYVTVRIPIPDRPAVRS